MAVEKRDNLDICNSLKLPFQDFVSEFCSRCNQADCTRSMHGRSRFENRITDWERKLFTDVQRLDSSDPRFPGIRAKLFLPVAPTQPGTSSAWLDARDLEPEKTYSFPTSPAPVVTELPAPEPAPAPAPKAPPPANTVPRTEPVLRNTAVKPGQMIGGAEKKPPPPVLDPWAPKQPLKPGEVLVQPGGRVILKR